MTDYLRFNCLQNILKLFLDGKKINITMFSSATGKVKKMQSGVEETKGKGQIFEPVFLLGHENGIKCDCVLLYLANTYNCP